MTFKEKKGRRTPVWCKAPSTNMCGAQGTCCSFSVHGNSLVLIKSDSSPGLKGTNAFEQI